MSTLPDVCKSPSAPVPYTNVAYARDLADGTVTVFSHNGAMNGIKGSRFAKSIGDNPGVGKGVKSGAVMDEATWLSWSPNVFMEGQPVTRLTDKMLMNKGNTISAGGYYTKWPRDSKQAKLCDVGCECWVKLRGSSKAGPTIDAVASAVGVRRYSACFKKTVDEWYPTTEYGKPGTAGLDSELGFWDPNNPNNTVDNGKPPGGQITRIPFWFGGDLNNVSGSRWIDAAWIDEQGKMTDIWDMKFGADAPNSPDKAKAYADIADQNGAVDHGEFRVPDECDNCDEREEEWQQSAKSVLNSIAKSLAKGPRIPIWVPGPGDRPGYP
ncbi:MAG TPA: DUF4150 domain-containing protein [Candidatus Angelobacter sp.]|nr:DUF4150 domain-containing protein [Candidatus Angelobacter sp.]